MVRLRVDRWLAAALLLTSAGLGCASPGRGPVARDLRFADTPRTERELAEPGIRAPEQEPDPDANYRAGYFAASGLYLSTRAHWSQLGGGDFDGDTVLTGPDTIFIPDAEDGLGYEFALGWMSRGWAMELSYTRIEYDGSIGSAPADIEYQAISWNGMRYLRANEPLQPCLLVGFVFPWADLEDASSFGGPFGNAELDNGFGIQTGLGLAWWFGPHLALDLRSLVSYQVFDEAEGVSGDSGTIDDGVDTWSFGVSLGLTWALGKADNVGGP